MARRQRLNFWSILFAVLFFGVFIGSCFAGATIDGSVAVHALEAHGFSEVKIVEKSIFFVSLRGCGRGDAAMFVAEATNPAGKRANVIVCVGWPMKAATVRVP